MDKTFIRDVGLASSRNSVFLHKLYLYMVKVFKIYFRLSTSVACIIYINCLSFVHIRCNTYLKRTYTCCNCVENALPNIIRRYNTENPIIYDNNLKHKYYITCKLYVIVSGTSGNIELEMKLSDEHYA